MSLGDVLPRGFFERDADLVARQLLGKLLIRRGRLGTCVGRILETEAYLAEGDPACHGVRGITKKNATMFGRPGLAYVYPIHARYCMNAVTEATGRASAVLIRAVEPLAGIEMMQRLRGVEKLIDLCRGPARLCEALGVDRRFDGWDFTRGRRLWLADDGMAYRASQIKQSPRIGVTSGEDALLRFFVPGNRFVSGRRS